MNEGSCADCGADTVALREYYMVHKCVWQESGMHEGLLCIGCQEHRLGRRLTAADFTDCPLNAMNAAGMSSERLQARLTA